MIESLEIEVYYIDYFTYDWFKTWDYQINQVMSTNLATQVMLLLYISKGDSKRETTSNC